MDNVNSESKSYEERFEELNIKNSAKVFEEENRARILEIFSIEEFKEISGIARLKKRGMKISHWISFCKGVGLNFNDDLVRYINKQGPGPVYYLSKFGQKKLTNDSIFTYVSENRKEIDRLFFGRRGLSLREVLINDIEKRYLTKAKDGLMEGFERTKHGKIALSCIFDKQVNKSNALMYKKLYNRTILKTKFQQNLDDYIFEEEIHSGIELLCLKNDEWENKIGIHTIRQVLGFKIRMRDFSQKYKLIFIEKMSYNIFLEATNLILESSDPVECIINLGFGKQTTKYFLEQKNVIDKRFYKKGHTSLSKYLLEFAKENQLVNTVKSAHEKYNRTLISLILGKSIKFNANLAHIDIYKYNQLINT